jgi:hypothetical protein
LAAKQTTQQGAASHCYTENAAVLTVHAAEADTADAADCCRTERVDTGGTCKVDDEALATEMELSDAAWSAAVPDKAEEVVGLDAVAAGRHAESLP